MRVNEVSKRYAKALLAAVKQKGTEKDVSAQLLSVAKIVEEDAQIKNFFANPIVTAEQKLSVIKKSFEGKGLSEEVFNLLLLLAENGRLSRVAEISEAYQNSSDAEQGITRGTIKSASAISDSVKTNLEQKIQKFLNKKIVLSFQEDKKILGGVVAQVGGWTFDDSIETHLKNINEDLNRRAK
jgi:F-type H+-transporting ATPase subunit delta